VKAWFAANEERLLTTDYCIDETLTLLVARKRPDLSIEAGQQLFRETIARLHFVTPDQVHRAWILFRQRAAAGWSFTDCTSKIVIDALEVRTAVALDDHFRQFGNLAVVP
jgi:predicted nucleic acid-binding protein